MEKLEQLEQGTSYSSIIPPRNGWDDPTVVHNKLEKDSIGAIVSGLDSAYRYNGCLISMTEEEISTIMRKAQYRKVKNTDETVKVLFTMDVVKNGAHYIIEKVSRNTIRVVYAIPLNGTGNLIRLENGEVEGLKHIQAPRANHVYECDTINAKTLIMGEDGVLREFQWDEFIRNHEVKEGQIFAHIDRSSSANHAIKDKKELIFSDDETRL